jgi:KTSC domain-containing protein
MAGERRAERIPLVPVESSMVSMAGYNPVKKILAIQFAKSGTIKHYAGVSEAQADAFFSAASHGRFLTAHIFNHFEVERMTGPCPQCGSEGWLGERCDDCGTADFAPAPEKPKKAKEASDAAT